MDSKVASIRDRLLKEREALLDLSTRNRLLNTPMRTRNVRTIEIVDEKPAEVFRLLSEGRGMTFLPGAQLSAEEKALLEADDKETGGIPQPTDNAVDERGIASRHTDLRLQTRLTSEGLQKRLFDIWYDARTLEEEQGVNILYLAMGLLRWYEDESSDLARHAPLILFPVALERSSAAERFQLKGRGEPPSPNITLQAKLKAEFGIVVEDFADEDDLDLPAYMAKVAETVSAKPRWEILPDAMVLGFYSFSKFLMYRDLDPDNWPETAAIKYHPLISGLLRDGFPASDPIIADTARIDDAIPPLELHHVVDADSSQAVAIAEAAAGRTMVIKGPPGTGKSQTITNVIAAAAAKGKRVLFVSEKMAALDVVFRRLKQNGLGPLTLELHSNKINKRTVLEELKRTKEGGSPRGSDDLTIVERLGAAQGELTGHAERLHKPLRPCGLTPYQIIGRLVAAANSAQSEPFALIGATEWTKEVATQRRELASEIAERLRDLGPLAEHPWKGVRCEPLDPMERGAVRSSVQDLADALTASMEEAEVATRELGAPTVTVLGELPIAARYLAVARGFPEAADQEVFSLPAWATALDKIDGIRRAGSSYISFGRPLDSVLNAAGWKADYSTIRTAIVTKGGRLFRFLDGNYRAQIALFRSYLKEALPSRQVDRIALLDSIVTGQEAKTNFDKLSGDGAALLGKLWKGADTDWEMVGLLLVWRNSGADLPASFWPRFASASRRSVSKAGVRLDAKLEAVTRVLEHLSDVLKLDWLRAFGCATKQGTSVELLGGRLTAWLEHGESLTRYIAVYGRLRVFADQGGGKLTDALLDGQLVAHKLPTAFDTAYSAVLRAGLFASWPELRAFDGDSHNRLVQKFRDLDRARIKLARDQIIAQHAAGRPSSAGGIGPLGVLNAELAKKRGHLPIRLLLDRAGPVIQQLKPVFMMSPLSVAQFLKPGGMKFDLLVMDEASQIEPVDSLGAVARADQIVVVGDERQLPPTSFFKKLTGEEDKDSDDESIAIQAKDAESILDLCLAKGVPHRMLSWHYRSKHQSLIAVSNREFYENKLYIVPSPYDAIAGMGLKFHLMKETAYDRGGTRTNPKEARAIAEAVMAHAKDTPELSLGVATFSVAQRQAVLKELELLRRENTKLEDFFSGTSQEPFFVKNLENIQGDERDVILISIGYGKTAEGYLAHSFGPLSADGGERRLNVLISRAKLRCEVFSNFTGADIDLERTRARGVAALKLFMTFAETGKFGLGESITDEHDSEFEEQVCGRLRSLGYDVKTQIGASGFRVDLAVSDPEKPGRFVLGIECDGAQYHSSRSARDRDRLRQQVLEAHGWIIHRVWSTDWYLRPDEELKKLEAAISGAKAEWRERDEQAEYRSKAVPLEFQSEIQDDVEVTTAVLGNGAAKSAVEDRLFYQEAEFPVDAGVELHEVPVAQLANYIVKVVDAEGPIHLDEVATRLRTLWGLKKAGGRIRAVVTEAAGIAIRRGQIGGEEFLHIPGAPIRVRDRSLVSSLSLRKPEMLPPGEIAAAMLGIVAENYGAKHDELIHACSRKLGYSSTSAQLKDVLSENIEHLISSRKLEVREGLLITPGQG